MPYNISLKPSFIRALRQLFVVNAAFSVGQSCLGGGLGSEAVRITDPGLKNPEKRPRFKEELLPAHPYFGPVSVFGPGPGKLILEQQLLRFHKKQGLGQQFGP